MIENRQIRVFVSSTFQDMKAERDYLMQTVFPRLRKKAAERDVSFIELDLRWGITEEEARKGKVVQVCLNEIDNSHPFFIGLLGDRYGWCPGAEILAQDTNLAERYPWIRQDIERGASVTEIEMQYGVLRREEDDLNACFFIKEDGDGIEPRQKELKDAVRSNTRYPYKEYSTAEELGAQVEEVFTELIERLFPRKGLSALELERLAQRSFLRSRCQAYIRKEADFKALDDFLNDREERYLVITGESGMGKSSLVANWLHDHEKDDSHHTIYHFVGNSGAEGDYNRILTRLADEIYDMYGIQKPDGRLMEQDGGGPDKILQNLLMRIAGGKPLLIVLDGINQLADDGSGDAKLLNWLPSVPKGCKMLFSTLEDDGTMETFRRRGYPVFRLEPLDNDRRRELVADYLRRFGKKLSPRQTARIADDPENRNTLVLRTLLDELVCFGVHEELDTRIDYYLAAESIRDFFQRVLQRAENDYGRELMRDVAALIAVSDNGMSETELLGMTHILPLQWSAFYCAFSTHFTVKNGLVNFSHRYLREAAVARYLASQQEAEFRKRIIGHFEPLLQSAGNDSFARGLDADGTCREKGTEARIWNELAHQYYCMRMNRELHALVLRPEVFDHFYKGNVGRLVSIWQQLRSDGFPLDDYLADERQSGEYYFQVGSFCDLYFQEFSTAEKIYNKVLILYSSLVEKDEQIIAMTLHNLGFLHLRIKEYILAEREYHEALEIQYRFAKKNPKTFEAFPIITLNALGILHTELHNYDLAEKEYHKALEIYNHLPEKSHEALEPYITKTLSNLGILHTELHNYDTAKKMYLEVLEIRRRLVEKDPDAFEQDLAMTLYNIGDLYSEIHDYEAAERAYYEALQIRRCLAKNNPDAFEQDLAMTLNNLGNTHFNLCDYDAAEREHNEALKIRRRLAEKKSKAFEFYVADTLNNLGVLHTELHNYNAAEKEYHEALKIRRKLTEKNPIAFESDLAKTLYNMGVLYFELQNYELAERAYNESLDIYYRLSEKNPAEFESYVTIIIENLAFLHKESGRENEYQKASSICQNTPSSDVSIAINDLEDFHPDINDHIIAEKDYLEALEIYRRLAEEDPGKYEPYVAALLNNLGSAHTELKMYDAAKKEFNEAIEIYQHLTWEHPGVYEADIQSIYQELARIKNIDSSPLKHSSSTHTITISITIIIIIGALLIGWLI